MRLGVIWVIWPIWLIYVDSGTILVETWRLRSQSTKNIFKDFFWSSVCQTSLKFPVFTDIWQTEDKNENSLDICVNLWEGTESVMGSRSKLSTCSFWYKKKNENVYKKQIWWFFHYMCGIILCVIRMYEWVAMDFVNCLLICQKNHLNEWFNEWV